MSETIIQLDDVSFGYSKRGFIVEGISFEIPEGSTTMLIGPNGSGKTTVLRLMVGLLKPEKGVVQVLGGTPKAQRAQIGYVPQRLDFDRTFPFTVLEFLRYSHRETHAEEILALLEKLGVRKLSDALIGNLSGGELQRVLIARALLSDPKVLYLDEPISGIDVGGERNFYDLIAEIKRERNITIVMVSHELHVVSKIATQVICINRKMCCSGEPSTVLVPEVLEEMYGREVSVYHHNV